jgi:serine/threonine protein kinase
MVGMRIGPYELKAVLDEGGMGVVFLAEQKEPLRRKVALKLVKPGMDSQDILNRFSAERQALALMDHPYIARALDAGTSPDGHPYFVMEYVDGIPITHYCDEKRLGTDDHLRLFRMACDACPPEGCDPSLADGITIHERPARATSSTPVEAPDSSYTGKETSRTVARSC